MDRWVAQQPVTFRRPAAAGYNGGSPRVLVRRRVGSVRNPHPLHQRPAASKVSRKRPSAAADAAGTVVVASGARRSGALTSATPTPSKRLRPSMMALRGLSLVEYPVEAFSQNMQEDYTGGLRRSSRVRLPVLEAWRNEHLVFQRAKGSPAPALRSVVLNSAGREQEQALYQVEAPSLQVPAALPGAPCA